MHLEADDHRKPIFVTHVLLVSSITGRLAWETTSYLVVAIWILGFSYGSLVVGAEINELPPSGLYWYASILLTRFVQD